MGCGEWFTKLDLGQAYQQLELIIITINAHKGLYQYNRLPYGVSSATGIFQRTIENLLQEILVRVDDILVTGTDRGNLDEVLKILYRARLHLKRLKCTFLAKEVVYLGRKFTEEVIQSVLGK